MPLPLTVSCFSKIQIGFTFLVPAHPGSRGKRAVKWVYIELRDVTHVVHDGRPRRHRNNGEHGQHGQADVVEDDDAVVRSDPVLGAHVARRTVEAADERFPGQRARVDFAVLVQVEQP